MLIDGIKKPGAWIQAKKLFTAKKIHLSGLTGADAEASPYSDARFSHLLHQN